MIASVNPLGLGGMTIWATGAHPGGNGSDATIWAQLVVGSWL
jgi:hypothetical protein